MFERSREKWIGPKPIRFYSSVVQYRTDLDL